MSAEIKNLVLTNQVFVCIGQAITGPVSLEEAKSWAEVNWGRSDAFVWCEGFTSWVSVMTFPQLKPQPKPATVNTLASLKPVVAAAEETTVSNYTSPGYSQPWTYPVNETTQTQVTQVTQVTQTQPVQVQPQQSQIVHNQLPPQYQAPVQQHVPVQQHAPVQHQAPVQHTAPAQQPVQHHIQQAAPAHQAPVYAAPVTTEPGLHQGFATPQGGARASKLTPPKTTLPERVRRLPSVDEIQIPIDPAVLKSAASRMIQIVSVVVVFGLLYVAATKLPLRDMSNQIQQAMHKT
ncbi:MAG: GYF domain-containing protein, partial [Bdellovibrionia bacterium]